jgi:hypothetical protein
MLTHTCTHTYTLILLVYTIYLNMSVYIVWTLSNICDIPHKKVVSMLNGINVKSEENPCPMNTLNGVKGSKFARNVKYIIMILCATNCLLSIFMN